MLKSKNGSCVNNSIFAETVTFLLYVLHVYDIYMYLPLQYRNAGNALAHYDGTGNEILEQTGGVYVCVTILLEYFIVMFLLLCTL